MAMMRVGIVRVGVMQRLVAVPMRMKLGHRALVRMLVVFVMYMTMFMLQRAVLMFVNVAFDEMQPESHAHEPPP
jgi:hypothetical protein